MNDTARSMSVRAKANNLAKRLGIAPQAALQAWFAERFLARVSMSGHADRIVVKGGTLMAALFGLAERTTMDIDATVLDTAATKRPCGRSSRRFVRSTPVTASGLPWDRAKPSERTTNMPESGFPWLRRWGPSACPWAST